jgi:predicted DNA-binding antitoxin AbrB/MazE fold protein
MISSFKAIFEDGVLKPLEPLGLPEHSLVYLQVASGSDLEPNSGSLSAQEFDQQLLILASDGPTLPADFSRADVYRDHD